MRKIKVGHRARLRDTENFFPTGFISCSHNFMPYFHFRCVAHATIDRTLIHSADACFSVMVCGCYSRAQLKTLSNLLNALFLAFSTSIFLFILALFLSASWRSLVKFFSSSPSLASFSLAAFFTKIFCSPSAAFFVEISLSLFSRQAFSLATFFV